MTKNVLTPVHLNGEWLLVRAPRTRAGASHVYVPTNTPRKHRLPVFVDADRPRRQEQHPATTLRSALRGMAAGAVRWLRGNRKAA